MIPALPMYRIVQQYATVRGLAFFTMQQQTIAFRLYHAHASINN